MRIQFYGTRGSGSVFPSWSERAAAQEVWDLRLLKRIFADLEGRLNSEGRLNCSLEDILGSPLGSRALTKYRDAFDLKIPLVYGGWTTCVHVRTDEDTDIVFDCGSGFRNCAKDLQFYWGDKKERKLFIFGSHSHRDHTEGFEQASVCFDPRNSITVYGNSQFLRALDDHLGIFSRAVHDSNRGIHSPLYYDLMPANFDAVRIVRPTSTPEAENGLGWDCKRTCQVEEEIIIDDVRITPFEVYHPAPCFGYRVESKGKVFVFCSDHELRHGTDPESANQILSLAAEERVRRYSKGADVLYRDGQFLRIEYDGIQGIGNSGAIPRIDWGHSCIEDVTAMAEECDVKHTLIGHHDPNRDWAELNRLNESLMRNAQAQGRRIELACAETVIEI